jgi:undecaprenyl-diphosphatase
MDILQAAVLGLVQGITEWLPISSSGHLAVAQYLWGLQESLFFDVMLHLSSLAAIMIAFRKDLWSLGTGILKKDPQKLRLLLYLFLATIPIAITGLLIRPYAQIFMSNMKTIALGFALTGILLALSRFFKNDDVIKPKNVIFVSLAQAIAILPGVSRSGSTISAGMISGLKREEAVSFSFLLAVPAIAGASFLELISSDLGTIDLFPIMIGMAVSFIVSLIAISLLKRLVIGGKLHYFAIYCFIAAFFAALI